MLRSPNVTVRHTTRGGGGRADRHPLGGEGVFPLPTGLGRIHTNSSVVDGGGGLVSAFKQASDPFLQEEEFTKKTWQEQSTELGWQSQLDAHSSVTLGKSPPSLSLSVPICPLWGLGHMLYDIQGVCDTEVLKLESGSS